MINYYVLYPEADKEVFFELCKKFEAEFTDFRKGQLIEDTYYDELAQSYTCKGERVYIKLAKAWDENQIELISDTNNSDVFDFVFRVKGSVVHKIRLEDSICHRLPEYIHTCHFLVNNTNDEKLIREIADTLLMRGCRRFAFYGKFADMWHNIFDEIFVCKCFNDYDSDVSLTTTVETLKCFFEGVSINFPGLQSYKYHCHVVYYDDETDIAQMQKFAECSD